MGGEEDLFFGEVLIFLEHADGHGFKGEIGDEPGHAGGIFKDGLKGGLREDGFLTAFEAEMMFNKGLNFIVIEGQEMIFQGDALIEGDQHRAHEAVGEMGLSGEDNESRV